MKDMTVEELINILCQSGFDVDLINAEAEILRRFAELEKELKAVKITHAVAEDIMHTNFNLCKSSAEHWKMMVKDLMCCGNCGKHYKDCQNELSYEFCDKWQSDGLSREERVENDTSR